MVIALACLVWAPVASAWSWPVKGPVLQGFQYDEASPYAAGQHRGIDIGAGAAGDPVVAPAAGTVTFAGTVPTSGRCVTIATADGYSVTLTHLGSVSVAKGAAVAEGAAVGTVGPSGTPDFTVPYVHLGIRVSADANGYVDPLGLLPALTPPAPPAPDAGGSASSGSVGATTGSGDGSTAGPSSVPAPTPSSAPAPAVAPSAPPVEAGGAGLVIRDGAAPAPAVSHPAAQAAERTAAPRRPSRVEKPPVQTVSKPRAYDGIVEEPQPTPAPRPTATPAPPEAVEPAAGPLALAVGPGIAAALAALGTLLGRTRRGRRLGAVVVRLPRQQEMRRAA